MKSHANLRPNDPLVRIGHVHLKVADLAQALRFYCGVIGIEITLKLGTYATFAWDGGHDHIGLKTWKCLSGLPPPPGT